MYIRARTYDQQLFTCCEKTAIHQDYLHSTRYLCTVCTVRAPRMYRMLYTVRPVWIFSYSSYELQISLAALVMYARTLCRLPTAPSALGSR